MKISKKMFKTVGAASLLSIFAIYANAADMNDNCKGKTGAECMQKEHMKGDMKSEQMKGDMKSEQMKGDMKSEQMKGDMKSEQMKDDMKSEQIKKENM